MKTLIISGTVSIHYVDGKIVCNYTLFLYGQSQEHPQVQFISNVVLLDSNHSAMCDHCKKVYADYFNTDEFNIVSLENIDRI